MADRRANHLNFAASLSDDKFLIRERTGNANMTGVRFAWFKFRVDDNSGYFKVYVYADQDDSDTICESELLQTSTLPATVTLAETNGSGASGTVYIDGVR